MNEVKIFESPLFGQVRIVTDASNEPLFSATDVCKALGYTNSRKAIADHVDTPDVTKRYIGVITGKKVDGTDAVQKVELSFVNESGLYSLIFGSKLDRARAFKRWITSEVLPSIRKTGGYMVVNSDETPEEIMARALKIADEALMRREQRIKQLEADNDMKAQTIDAQTQELKVAAPKVEYYDKTLSSTDCMTTSQIANELGMYTGMLNKKLAEAGIQYKQGNAWLLKKPYREWNLHGTRTFDFKHSNGNDGARIYMVWNQRGRRFVHALYNNDFNLRRALQEIKGELGSETANGKAKK